MDYNSFLIKKTISNKNISHSLLFIISMLLIASSLFISFIIKLESDKPKQIAKTTFMEYMEDKGCSLIDIKKEEQYDGINEYLITDKDSCPYILSYTTFSDKKVLDNFYNQVLYDVLNRNGHITYNLSINLFSNYSEYMTKGDYLKGVILNKDSILYISSEKDYSTDILNILEDLDLVYGIN